MARQSNYEMETKVHAWEKNDRGEEVQINVANSGRGSRYVDIRTWYPDKETDEMAMGKGCAFPLEDCHMDEFFAGIEKLKRMWEAGELTPKKS